MPNSQNWAIDDLLAKILRDAAHRAHNGLGVPGYLEQTLICCCRQPYQLTGTVLQGLTRELAAGRPEDDRWSDPLKMGIIQAAAFQMCQREDLDIQLWEGLLANPSYSNIALRVLGRDFKATLRYLGLWWSSKPHRPEETLLYAVGQAWTDATFDEPAREEITHHLQYEGRTWPPELREAVNQALKAVGAPLPFRPQRHPASA